MLISIFLILPFLPFLGYLALGGAAGFAAGYLLACLTDNDVKQEASNHTGGYDLSSQYSEIKRINEEKSKGYYNVGLQQHLIEDDRCVDSWSMKAKSVGSMYEGKRIYYDKY